jgi:hypothetical protein
MSLKHCHTICQDDILRNLEEIYLRLESLQSFTSRGKTK